MHVYDYRSGRRNGIGHCLVLLQAPHIVHDNAEIDWARGADIGFVCIDRDRDVAVPELGENESDAGKLLGFGDERRSRPRRLPTDIDDIGALFPHSHRMRERRIRGKETLAVGKRSQRHIEDSNEDPAGTYLIEKSITLGAVSRPHRPFLSCADIHSGSA
jgi:hypothetical protein